MRLPAVKPFREMDPIPIGVAFLVVTVALLLLSFNLDKLPFTSGTSYSAAFARADGLRKGDHVMVGGVVVGEVTGVGLEGTHVRVDYAVTNDSVHLGHDTTASIQIATLLGNKYLAVDPGSSGTWPAERELPLERTRSPFDVAPALQALGRTTDRIDTDQLAAALDTLATTFKDSPDSVRSMLDGLSRLSTTIASRDDELGRLLRHADTLSTVLAERRGDFTALFGDGDRLLQMLQQRRAVIDSLLRNTASMSRQLRGLVADNEESIGPALDHVHGVLSVLNAQQDNLDRIIKGLYVFVRGEVDATGNGPWFDGTAINATNPFQAGIVPRAPTAGRARSVSCSAYRPPNERCGGRGDVDPRAPGHQGGRTRPRRGDRGRRRLRAVPPGRQEDGGRLLPDSRYTSIRAPTSTSWASRSARDVGDSRSGRGCGSAISYDADRRIPADAVAVSTSRPSWPTGWSS